MMRHAAIIAITVSTAAWSSAVAIAEYDTIEANAKPNALLRAEKVSYEDNPEPSDPPAQISSSELRKLRNELQDLKSQLKPDPQSMDSTLAEAVGSQPYQSYEIQSLANSEAIKSRLKTAAYAAEGAIANAAEGTMPVIAIAADSTDSTGSGLGYQSYEFKSLADSAASALKTVEYELNIQDVNDVGTVVPQKSKVRLAILSQFFFFGMLGFDRCFMDQWLLGLVKGLTGGGFFIWAIADFFVIFWNMMTKKTSIDMLKLQATFKKGSEIDDAFLVAILMLAFTVTSSGFVAYYFQKGAFNVWPFASSDADAAATGDDDKDKPKEPDAGAEKAAEEPKPDA